ncbi:uncharacterized protein ARMOST_15944 [Armillaria ostoyae]|uniref:Uncharacterized protein n=1 Tax=Armillaria ostoyae TaxID=47428 RepID=A0A284RUV4_ARMOS|nr:uncharacterized protein ARMOST_15944 [Armillaria ostoyae]
MLRIQSRCTIQQYRGVVSPSASAISTSMQPHSPQFNMADILLCRTPIFSRESEERRHGPSRSRKMIIEGT